MGWEQQRGQHRGQRGGHQWGQQLCDLFEDLEQQAEGLHLAERDAEVADRSRSEYSAVTIASRLHASVGDTVSLGVLGVGRVVGELARVGLDWCLVRAEDQDQEWIVRLAAITSARGLSTRSLSEAAQSVLARLGVASPLRGISDSGMPVALWSIDGTQERGVVVRVGSDFVEVRSDTDVGALPFAALAAVRSC